MIVKIDSTTVSQIEYKEDEQKLIATFSSGRTHDYCNVKLKDFTNLQKVNDDKNQGFEKYFSAFGKEHKCT